MFSGGRITLEGGIILFQRATLGIIPSEDNMMGVEGVVIFSKGGITPQDGTMTLEGGANFTEGGMKLGMVS